jgi:ribosomal-protein-alanine N-acetyltransferase
MPPASEARAEGRTAVLETERLVLRRLATDDAPFLLELLNEPSFLRYIGDKGVRTEADARRYVEAGPLASYERFGFGLYRVELRESGEPIGMCGLLKRDALPDVDVGFAFLPRKGYAFESAAAVLAHARDALGRGRILAITTPDNVASIRLLEKLGFRFERMARVPEDGPEVKVFGREASGGVAGPADRRGES